MDSREEELIMGYVVFAIIFFGFMGTYLTIMHKLGLFE